ncbi:mitochondrial 37s ribosomal protein sws2 [Lichtheimia corymbifera JMRC:FSU:9682]|uniref:Mitochondrial 37s ribosomal protein sws2 n=1 Tax=Lichtheimia corymbifera JMRC:FSU:9682 TaxID=1263082 RepID=A0A068RHJ6_9FUNG|nr:mitochondrial 37s ribosomal protein sws2 [Lichtheimia corymbifera JMRC:FSU:9682]
MLHLLGVNLPDRKLVSTALQYFYGIGEPTALKLCQELKFPQGVRVSELNEVQINDLTNKLASMTIETDLKRQVREHVMHHRNIGNYIGRRHAMSLPVRGQHTRNNAKTAKRLNGRWVQRRGYSVWSEAQASPLQRFFNNFGSL